jgi:peptide methionine sulfoxide reductase MsrA
VKIDENLETLDEYDIEAAEMLEEFMAWFDDEMVDNFHDPMVDKEETTQEMLEMSAENTEEILDGVDTSYMNAYQSMFMQLLQNRHKEKRSVSALAPELKIVHKNMELYNKKFKELDEHGEKAVEDWEEDRLFRTTETERKLMREIKMGSLITQAEASAATSELLRTPEFNKVIAMNYDAVKKIKSDWKMDFKKRKMKVGSFKKALERMEMKYGKIKDQAERDKAALPKTDTAAEMRIARTKTRQYGLKLYQKALMEKLRTILDITDEAQYTGRNIAHQGNQMLKDAIGTEGSFFKRLEGEAANTMSRVNKQTTGFEIEKNQTIVQMGVTEDLMDSMIDKITDMFDQMFSIQTDVNAGLIKVKGQEAREESVQKRAKVDNALLIQGAARTGIEEITNESKQEVRMMDNDMYMQHSKNKGYLDKWEWEVRDTAKTLWTNEQDNMAKTRLAMAATNRLKNDQHAYEEKAFRQYMDTQTRLMAAHGHLRSSDMEFAHELDEVKLESYKGSRDLYRLMKEHLPVVARRLQSVTEKEASSMGQTAEDLAHRFSHLAYNELERMMNAENAYLAMDKYANASLADYHGNVTKYAEKVRIADDQVQYYEKLLQDYVADVSPGGKDYLDTVKTEGALYRELRSKFGQTKKLEDDTLVKEMRFAHNAGQQHRSQVFYTFEHEKDDIDHAHKKLDQEFEEDVSTIKNVEWAARQEDTQLLTGESKMEQNIEETFKDVHLDHVLEQKSIDDLDYDMRREAAKEEAAVQAVIQRTESAGEVFAAEGQILEYGASNVLHSNLGDGADRLYERRRPLVHDLNHTEQVQEFEEDSARQLMMEHVRYQLRRLNNDIEFRKDNVSSEKSSLETFLGLWRRERSKIYEMSRLSESDASGWINQARDILELAAQHVEDRANGYRILKTHARRSMTDYVSVLQFAQEPNVIQRVAADLSKAVADNKALKARVLTDYAPRHAHWQDGVSKILGYLIDPLEMPLTFSDHTKGTGGIPKAWSDLDRGIFEREFNTTHEVHSEQAREQAEFAAFKRLSEAIEQQIARVYKSVGTLAAREQMQAEATYRILGEMITEADVEAETTHKTMLGLPERVEMAVNGMFPEPRPEREDLVNQLVGLKNNLHVMKMSQPSWWQIMARDKSGYVLFHTQNKTADKAHMAVPSALIEMLERADGQAGEFRDVVSGLRSVGEQRDAADAALELGLRTWAGVPNATNATEPLAAPA